MKNLMYCVLLISSLVLVMLGCRGYDDYPKSSYNYKEPTATGDVTIISCKDIERVSISIYKIVQTIPIKVESNYFEKEILTIVEEKDKAILLATYHKNNSSYIFDDSSNTKNYSKIESIFEKYDINYSKEDKDKDNKDNNGNKDNKSNDKNNKDNNGNKDDLSNDKDNKTNNDKDTKDDKDKDSTSDQSTDLIEWGKARVYYTLTNKENFEISKCIVYLLAEAFDGTVYVNEEEKKIIPANSATSSFIEFSTAGKKIVKARYYKYEATSYKYGGIGQKYTKLSFNLKNTGDNSIREIKFKLKLNYKKMGEVVYDLYDYPYLPKKESKIINNYFYHDDELIDYSISDIVLFGSYY
ncbi:MAG: hypothetical protein A2086_15840 [Spirochaetes bacterium GWD1_27_9]|nr:MAG: hypothetical protein A2Z98_11110 [Spirochaetes bacterium GWB1_27_13]OHD27082.1 MAG: hypothetical protein A2Y34_11330 [Spirochaetes bacterium GWC1_27_15]OHD42851.1 MAG: hypothetical protein A2086_15840 [Spirochaetes bacterium GWD1_27_9]